MRRFRLLSLSLFLMGLFPCMGLAVLIGPSTPEGISPLGRQPEGATQPTCSWNAADGAEWYQVKVWETDLTDSSRVLITHKWVPAPQVSWQIDSKLWDGTYKWAVVAWNHDGFSNWSAEKSFAITTRRPLTPTIITPVEWDEKSSGGSLTYQWKPDSWTEWYQVYIERDGVVLYNKWLTSAEVAVDANRSAVMVTNHDWGKYKWCVRGWNGNGMGRWSELPGYTIGQLDARFGFQWQHLSNVSPEWYQIAIKVKTEAPIVRTVWIRANELVPSGMAGFDTWNIDPELPPETYYYWIRPWSASRKMGPWDGPKTFYVN